MAPENSPNNLYLGLIVVFGLGLGYLLYSNATVPTPELSSANIAASETDALKIESLRLDLSIFENLLFKELKIFGDIPVEPGTTGKTNLFSP